MEPTFTFNYFPAEVNLKIMHYAAPGIGTMREVEKTLRQVAQAWFKDACNNIAKDYQKLETIVASASEETDPRELFQLLINALHTKASGLNCDKLIPKNLKSYERMNHECDYHKIIEEIKKAEIEKNKALLSKAEKNQIIAKSQRRSIGIDDFDEWYSADFNTPIDSDYLNNDNLKKKKVLLSDVKDDFKRELKQKLQRRRAWGGTMDAADCLRIKKEISQSENSETILKKENRKSVCDLFTPINDESNSVENEVSDDLNNNNLTSESSYQNENNTSINAEKRKEKIRAKKEKLKAKKQKESDHSSPKNSVIARAEKMGFIMPRSEEKVIANSNEKIEKKEK